MDSNNPRVVSVCRRLHRADRWQLHARKSATVDEPQHLTAVASTALRLRDYRIDPEHPPFLRLWAALPLLAMPDVRLDTNTVSWSTGQGWDFSRHFLYELNDADHLLYRGEIHDGHTRHRVGRARL